MGIGEHDAAFLWREFLLMTLQEGQVALDRRKWSTQFVRSIGDKAALGLRCALQGGQHFVERLHHLRHLVVSTRPRHSLAETPKACPACCRGSYGACGGD